MARATSMRPTKKNEWVKSLRSKISRFIRDKPTYQQNLKLYLRMGVLSLSSIAAPRNIEELQEQFNLSLELSPFETMEALFLIGEPATINDLPTGLESIKGKRLRTNVFTIHKDTRCNVNGDSKYNVCQYGNKNPLLIRVDGQNSSKENVSVVMINLGTPNDLSNEKLQSINDDGGKYLTNDRVTPMITSNGSLSQKIDGQRILTRKITTDLAVVKVLWKDGQNRMQESYKFQWRDDSNP